MKMDNSKKIYKIVDIYEEDFGCEGVPDGHKIHDIVILQDENGEKKSIKAADAFLYEKNIDIGDIIKIDNDNNIEKVV